MIKYEGAFMHNRRSGYRSRKFRDFVSSFLKLTKIGHGTVFGGTVNKYGKKEA
jgi:hypothetical protein